MRLSGFWTGLDWDGWSYGLIKGAIAGGATSVYAAFGALIVDPHDFAFGSAKSFKLIGWVFLFSALMQTFAYLSKSPLPEKITVEKTLTSQTTTDAKGGTVTVDKVVEKTTQVVPIDAKPAEK